MESIVGNAVEKKDIQVDMKNSTEIRMEKILKKVYAIGILKAGHNALKECSEYLELKEEYNLLFNQSMIKIKLSDLADYSTKVKEFTTKIDTIVKNVVEKKDIQLDMKNSTEIRHAILDKYTCLSEKTKKYNEGKKNMILASIEDSVDFEFEADKVAGYKEALKEVEVDIKETRQEVKRLAKLGLL